MRANMYLSKIYTYFPFGASQGPSGAPFSGLVQSQSKSGAPGMLRPIPQEMSCSVLICIVPIPPPTRAEGGAWGRRVDRRTGGGADGPVGGGPGLIWVHVHDHACVYMHRMASDGHYDAHARVQAR